MKKSAIIILSVFLLLSSATYNILAQETIITVYKVYTDPAVKAGDQVAIQGYYTQPGIPLLLGFYGDYDTDQAYPAQSTLLLKGTQPPENARYGGLLIVRGTLAFEPYPDHKHPEDSLQAFIQDATYEILYDGEGSAGAGQPITYPDLEVAKIQAADSCKFAILISGGVNYRNNHSKYWENLVALYNHKIASGYPKENIFVNYYHGKDSARDNRIDPVRIQPATKEAIKKSFDDMVAKFKKCKDAGKKITFQKMITNHGSANGDIDLLGNNVLTPADLRTWQQMVIDSCCSTMYEEFLQCYAGKVVDEMMKLDSKNKTKIFLNSAADQVSGHSPHNQVHHYLKAKIDSLAAGKPYPEAVVAGKLAYDAYLQSTVDRAHNNANWYRAHPLAENRAVEMAKWVADSTKRANKICKSRNVTIIPMQHYCQTEQFYLPPHGSLELGFKGDANNCGNVTVYKGPEVCCQARAAVWNWNIPGSYRFKTGQDKRIINGDAEKGSTIWVHNDNGMFQMTAEVKGSFSANESPSNIEEYAGFSIGHNDGSSYEFGYFQSDYYVIHNVEQLGFPLAYAPMAMGPDFVQTMEVQYNMNITDPFWTNMELILDLIAVTNTGNLYVAWGYGDNQFAEVPITGDGRYRIPLGDLTMSQAGHIYFSAESGVAFQFDSWGLQSMFAPDTWVEDLDASELMPESFSLSQNYPNPFNAETVIQYQLPENSKVKIAVYDLRGRLVRVLVDKEEKAGQYKVMWNGKNDSDVPAASGVYMFRIKAGDFRSTKKMILLK